MNCSRASLSLAMLLPMIVVSGCGTSRDSKRRDAPTEELSPPTPSPSPNQSEGSVDDGASEDESETDDFGEEEGNGTGQGEDDQIQGPPAPSFTQIRDDVFASACLGCHSGARAAEGVDLSSYELLMAATASPGDANDGITAPVVVAGNAEASLLWQAISSDWMPFFSDPLTEEEKVLVRAWIDGGANP